MRTLITGLVVSLSASICSASVVEWPIAMGGNGHAYEVILVPGGISWEDARDAAVLRGGHLATLTSLAENDFVFLSVASDSALWFAGTFGPWLGGSQLPGTTDPAANWSWVTGEPWDFTNWGVGEPNDSYGQIPEHYLHFDNLLDDPIPGSLWNDYSNDAASPIISYIVEYPVPAPNAALPLGVFAATLARRRRS